jgi:RhtB (resistance to homoserine/threonine) family protein
MNEITILTTLAVVHFVALMSPGPDFALVVQNATRYGRQTGLYIALGLSCGILLHSILSLTGISYLVHQQPTLFALLQLAGGSYLFYLGYGALKASWASLRNAKANESTSAEQPSLLLGNKREAFSRGFATNILNPKALVFFVSLMSSLVPASMSLTGKGLALMILWSISLLWFSFLAWALSTQRMQRKIKATAHYVDGLCGILFTVLGLGILWQSTTAITALF